MKKLMTVLMCVLLVSLTLVSCAKKAETTTTSAAPATATPTKTETAPAQKEPTTKNVKVGLLCIGDENDQGYSYNFIQGRDEATALLAADGINVEWVTKYNIGEDSSCTDANIEAVAEGCEIIFNNSYGFEPYMLEVAKEYPDITFVGCTNCASRFDGLDHTHNAFANIYEGRYVAGVVAGMKLNQMIEEGRIKPEQAVIGYVGAYSFAEVISGFSAYYLGAKSVCPSVTMKVTFVGSWSDATAESDAALALADQGCVMISQHSDNTTPATAAQSRGVFHTGYNADMTAVAPAASLISTRIDWAVYFYETITAFVEGKEIPQDWCKGMGDGAVVMTKLNEAIAAPGTAAKIEETIKGLADGSIKVFDTSKFTVDGGQTLTHAFALDTDGDFTPDTSEAVYDGEFHESEFQSAPYFTAKIDGITWLNAAY